jgi:plasmid maintenance system antidote protein VapI
MVSGVNVSVVHRFLGGERDITLTTASKLAHLIGLQLTRKKKRTTKV